jgi:methyl-accepting chemotaxis protein
MIYFLNISTRAKLLLAFGLMVALLATVSGIAYRDTVHVKESQRVLFQEDMAVAYDLMTLRNTGNRERVILMSLVMADPAEQATLLQQLHRATAEIDALTIKLAAHKAADTVFAQQYDKMLAARREFDALRDQQLIPALSSGNRDEASRVIFGQMNQKFRTFRGIADEAGDRQFEDAEKRMRESEELVATAQTTLLVANLLAVAIGLLLVLALDRVIAQPLREAAKVAQRIATGDLTVRVPTSGGKDEVGTLLQSLDAMVSAWKQMMTETNTGIATLSAAASEILAGTAQVSAGASETAAAISETTATVEEVKQTALLSSQKARTVSDAAQKAALTAETGRQAVEDGIEGMESIQAQMGSIAETIVRLSERSQAIAEIIATVSGLAEQSNLLAVNAAIEAAKAGDHGKGFGVVAQEVKDLADQSKQATKQVRVILNDIQKAVSAAVMTTEQGSKTVAIGVEQTMEAGKAIKTLSENISDAAVAAAQIAASSQQQLAGMDQVAMAMENIKQVSGENAAGSRQSEASARNLHELGQKLRQISERFKL